MTGEARRERRETRSSLDLLGVWIDRGHVVSPIAQRAKDEVGRAAGVAGHPGDSDPTTLKELEDQFFRFRHAHPRNRPAARGQKARCPAESLQPSQHDVNLDAAAAGVSEIEAREPADDNCLHPPV